MDEDRDQPRSDPESDPEERALSGNPDHPPQQADHTPDNDRELLRQGGRGEDRPQASPGAS